MNLLFQLFPVPRKFCRMEGRRFRRGRVFITKDCTRKCKCRKNGIPRCTPLCKKQKSVPVCRVGERLEELSLLYAGGRCSCTKQFCLRNESKFVLQNSSIKASKYVYFENPMQLGSERIKLPLRILSPCLFLTRFRFIPRCY